MLRLLIRLQHQWQIHRKINCLTLNSRNQKVGCGFPIAKIAVIFSLATGALVSSLIDVLNVGDVKLARLLYQFLNPEDVLLGDRAFCSYADFYWIKNIGCDAVIRKNDGHRQNFETGYFINKQDRIVIWHKPKKCPLLSNERRIYFTS
jgi:hypothetical protein